MKEYIEFYQLEIRHIYYNHSYVQFFKDSNFEIYHRISFCKDSKFLIKHRENDKPAFISSKGITAWYNNGKWYETGT